MKRTLPLLVVATALIVRIVFFQHWQESPFLESPVLDARGYASWASEIAGGQLVWDEFRIHGPGYPYFLAILLKLTGHDLVRATFANSLLALAWILLLHRTVRRLLPFPTAEVTALLAAVYWPFLHFEGHLLATTWFTFLMVTAAFLVTRALTGGSRPSVSWAGAGLVLGLAAITRPNAIAVLPFVVALAGSRAAGPIAAAARARRAALCAGGFLLLVAPVLVHNHRLSGTIALQDHAAFNLYLGNSADSPGYVYVRIGPDWDRLADAPRREAGATSPAQRSAWYRDRVLDHARSDPVGFARLQVRKLALFLNRHEIRTTLSPYFFDSFAPLQRVLPGFGFVGPLALVGLVLAWRAPRRPWPLYAFALPGAALVILTVVGSRYRVPVVPFLVPFAAWTLVRIGQWTRRRDLVSLGFCAGGLAAALFVVHRPHPELTPNFSAESAQVAAVLQERGDLEGAAAWWTRARSEDPGRIETYVSHAALALGTGDMALVEELTRLGLEQRAGHPLLLMMRGRALLLLKRPEESIAALRTVLPFRPRDPDLLAGLARAHADAGRPDSSLHYFRRAIASDPNRPEVLEDTARLLLRLADSGAIPPERAQSLRTEAQALRERARQNPAGTTPPTPPPAP